MFERLIGKTTAPLALLSLLSTAALASDDEAGIEEAGESANEIIQYTRVLFDCDMLIESIEPSPIQHREIDLYFITLTAEGIECEQAFDVLNHRGRSRGLFFALPKEPDDGPEVPGQTNLGLIHEIDPEVEE